MAKATQPAERPRGESNGHGNGRKPQYIARAKQHPDSEFMQTIGAAWAFREGDGLVVKLQFIPAQNWDGSFILVAPKEGD